MPASVLASQAPRRGSATSSSGFLPGSLRDLIRRAHSSRFVVPAHAPGTVSETANSPATMRSEDGGRGSPPRLRERNCRFQVLSWSTFPDNKRNSPAGWLMDQAGKIHSLSDLKKRTLSTPCLIQRASGCGLCGVELPAEGELDRIINAALNGFFQDVHQRIPDVRACIDSLLVVPESAAVSAFEVLKTDPGKAGVENRR